MLKLKQRLGSSSRISQRSIKANMKRKNNNLISFLIILLILIAYFIYTSIVFARQNKKLNSLQEEIVRQAQINETVVNYLNNSLNQAAAENNK